MGQWVPAGQQVYALPALPWWVPSHHTPESWAEWCWGPGGPRQAMFRWSGSGQVSPWPGQACGQGPRLWGDPSHREMPLPRCLLAPSHLGMFLGPDLLSALFLSSSCPQRRSFREFCLQHLNHCHLSKIQLGSLVRYLVLFSFCPQDFVVPVFSITCSSTCL